MVLGNFNFQWQIYMLALVLDLYSIGTLQCVEGPHSITFGYNTHHEQY